MKTMRVSREAGGTANIRIEAKRVEPVTKFRYLGSFISEDGKCETEIKV